MLIGVADAGSVHRLAGDYTSLHKNGRDDRDTFALHLNQLTVKAFGETAASTVSTQLHTVGTGPGSRACAGEQLPGGGERGGRAARTAGKEVGLLRPDRERDA